MEGEIFTKAQLRELTVKAVENNREMTLNNYVRGTRNLIMQTISERAELNTGMSIPMSYGIDFMDKYEACVRKTFPDINIEKYNNDHVFMEYTFSWAS